MPRKSKSQSQKQNNQQLQPKKKATDKKKKGNFSFLNFTNQGGFMNAGIGRSQQAPSASGRTLTTMQPQFLSGKGRTVVRHSEFVKDVVGFNSFTTEKFYVNPGVQFTFPWLSTIAPSFEKYRITKLWFRYEVLCGTSQTGKVFYVPSYDPTLPAPVDKTEALTYDLAIGAQPWIRFDVMIPDKYLSTYNEYFIRQQVLADPNSEPIVDGDIKTYDPVSLFLCTEGIAVDGTVVGELWIDYEIELINPIGIPGGLSSFNLYQNSIEYVQTEGFGDAGQYLFGDPELAGISGAGPFVFSQDTITFTRDFVGMMSLTIVTTGGSPGGGTYLQWPPTFTVTDVTSQDGTDLTSGWYNSDVPLTGSSTQVQTVTFLARAGATWKMVASTLSSGHNPFQAIALRFAPFWTSPVAPSKRRLRPKRPIKSISNFILKNRNPGGMGDLVVHDQNTITLSHLKPQAAKRFNDSICGLAQDEEALRIRKNYIKTLLDHRLKHGNKKVNGIQVFPKKHEEAAEALLDMECGDEE